MRDKPEHYQNSRDSRIPEQQNYAHFTIPQQQPQRPPPQQQQQQPQRPPPKQQQQQQQQTPTQQYPQQQYAPPYQQQDYKYPNEEREHYNQFMESGHHAPFQQRRQPPPRDPSAEPFRDDALYEQNKGLHNKLSYSNSNVREERRGPFLPARNEDWFGG